METTMLQVSYFAILVLFGIAVFYLSRWGRTVIAVLVLGTVLVYAAIKTMDASYAKMELRFIRQGITSLSQSMAKQLHAGNAAKVSAILEQLSSKDGHLYDVQYSRFVSALAYQEDSTNRVQTITTNGATESSSQ
jgi:hypothetical protein